MQILPPDISSGQAFGQALGQGLGSGLQALAEAKLQQVLTQKQAARTEQGLIASGVDPAKARQM
jgi:hypothetical protein